MENIPVIRTIRGALRVNRENQLSAFAAQAAFFLLLSFFSICNDIVNQCPLFTGYTGGIYGNGNKFIPE